MTTLLQFGLQLSTGILSHRHLLKTNLNYSYLKVSGHVEFQFKFSVTFHCSLFFLANFQKEFYIPYTSGLCYYKNLFTTHFNQVSYLYSQSSSIPVMLTLNKVHNNITFYFRYHVSIVTENNPIFFLKKLLFEFTIPIANTSKKDEYTKYFPFRQNTILCNLIVFMVNVINFNK